MKKQKTQAPPRLEAVSIFEEGALDPKGAAHKYGGSPALYRKAMDDGRISYFRIGKKRLMPMKALHAFFASTLVEVSA